MTDSNSTVSPTASQMPVIGLGLWKVDGAAAPALVEEAARAGYRHFDCASDYGNEAEVGAGLQKISVPASLVEKICG